MSKVVCLKISFKQTKVILQNDSWNITSFTIEDDIETSKLIYNY